MKTDDYALIVAHPDDEVLWASSILENAKKIIICFSSVNGNNTLSKSRQKLQQHYPLLSTKFLSINQPYNYTNKASTVELNNDLSKTFLDNEYLSHQSGFQSLVAAIRDEVNNISTVFTHNPWGEYGHPDHTLVHKAVLHAIENSSIKVFVFGYSSRNSNDIIQDNIRNFTNKPIKLKPDLLIFRKLKAFYTDFNCWTWDSSYHPPKVEFFYPYFLSSSEIMSRPFKPKVVLNYIYQPFILNRIFVFSSNVINPFFRVFTLQDKLLFSFRIWIVPKIKRLVRHLLSLKYLI